MAATARKKAIFTSITQSGAGTSDWVIPKRGFFNLNSFSYHVLTLINVAAGTAKIQTTSDDPADVLANPGAVDFFDWDLGDLVSTDGQNAGRGITAYRIIAVDGDWIAKARSEF